MPMLQSCNKPRASCAAASRRLAPRCRMALLPRPAGEAATTAPMHVSRQHPMQQLQQGTSRGRPAPSRLAPARCCGTGTGARASGTFAADGEGRGGRDLQPPAGDKAGSGDSSPKQPTDAGAHPADAKASRQQQAAEMVLPLLQEALRPLVEGQVGWGWGLGGKRARVVHVLSMLAGDVVIWRQGRACTGLKLRNRHLVHALTCKGAYYHV